MASPEQIAELRRKTSEPDTDTYSDETLNTMIDNNGDNVDRVAGIIWEEKSSQYAELVDISEAGSSRKNSQLQASAIKQAQYYFAKSGDGTEEAGVDYPTTTQIVRPTA